jgi:prevent-host-death family protein
MDISITQFKQRCLEIVREVERTGRPVTVTRRGRIVARLQPAALGDRERAQKPWEQLRACGGRLLATAEESVLADSDFEALR